MDRNEIIFFAIIVIAYLICAFTLNIPQAMNLMLAGLILAIFLIILLVEYSKKFENENITKIARIIIIILVVISIITSCYEIWFDKTLPMDSTTLFPLFIIALICVWFFKKNEK